MKIATNNWLWGRLDDMCYSHSKCNFSRIDRRTEQVKTGQVNLDQLNGHFCGHFCGRLHGTFRGESLKD